MTASTNEIIQSVALSNFIAEAKQKSSQKIIVNNNHAIKEMLESATLIEITHRIKNGDANALSILIAAKERIKSQLPNYMSSIKLTIMALKPVCLLALILVSNQIVESV